VADQPTQIWIGTIEVRSPHEGHDLLEAAKGAFVNVVTWAADAEQYRHNAGRVIASLGGLLVLDVLNAAPVDEWRAWTENDFNEEIEDLISRAHDNPRAILYGTFHVFAKDDG
jgi:hypothetical protein